MTAGSKRLYLDYNATSPILPQAYQAVMAALTLPGNPSSVHAEGRAAKALLESARGAVAQLCAVSPDGVLFTSGATEAAAMALAPQWLKLGKPWQAAALAVLETDHPCLLAGGGFDAVAVTRLAVDSNGVLIPDALAQWLNSLAGAGGILALSLANSETGVLQNLDTVRAALDGHDVLLVLDAVQVAGRLPIDQAGGQADALLLSAHKLGGPKGVGALVLRDENTRPYALIRGGGQERGRRAGTESLPLIAGFGAAAQYFASVTPAHTMRHLQQRLELGLRSISTDIGILGEKAERLPNTTAFFHPQIQAETAQIAFDLAGIALSSGSACSSGKVGPSHVLQAMVNAGLQARPQAGALRVSLGHATSEADIDHFLAIAGKQFSRFAQSSD
ncbi:aminotransferase class V-fold PLP-dependent enzyme [Aureimonas fodinaquatilis]|uniref:Cysteine desulfurase n=1 Tax=Aureimonas fodinaquatilis TaxID=2565783 RepID=A0A5B0DZB9_9HYPH|nr:aminotransferase class V-fold PLP-dependent enzyme [Aureimonas fodinaquatilis]KAA0970549.1 aminotransferase class V-fold PLP-dependent enzyme [Aureimonas fodinaquatilis]